MKQEFKVGDEVEVIKENYIINHSNLKIGDKFIITNTKVAEYEEGYWLGGENTNGNIHSTLVEKITENINGEDYPLQCEEDWY